MDRWTIPTPTQIFYTSNPTLSSTHFPAVVRGWLLDRKLPIWLSPSALYKMIGREGRYSKDWVQLTPMEREPWEHATQIIHVFQRLWTTIDAGTTQLFQQEVQDMLAKDTLTFEQCLVLLGILYPVLGEDAQKQVMSVARDAVVEFDASESSPNTSPSRTHYQSQDTSPAAGPSTGLPRPYYR